MKPSLTRTYDREVEIPGDEKPVRLALTLNAWFSDDHDPAEEELKAALVEASAVVERSLFHTVPLELIKPDCQDCRFYAPDYHQCRRSPATLEAIRWPTVGPGDWCGEFSPLAR